MRKERKVFLRVSSVEANSLTAIQCDRRAGIRPICDHDFPSALQLSAGSWRLGVGEDIFIIYYRSSLYKQWKPLERALLESPKIEFDILRHPSPILLKVDVCMVTSLDGESSLFLYFIFLWQ